MRAGWQEKKLGDVLTLEYGKPLLPGERKANGKYAVYGANGIKDRSDRFFSNKPSIIVGRKGSAGEITLTEDKFWPLDVTYFVAFDETKYDLQFLYHLLSLQDLPRLAKGVKPGINRNEVYAMTARMPPLLEQQRIVAILDEAFAGLATATANAEKNLKNARELFENNLQSIFYKKGKEWIESPLEDCLVNVKYTAKVKRRDFLTVGKFPIISQEAEFVNGYWANSTDLFRVTTPLVIFGDHTKILKYVDFDFVLGADGVKILQPSKDWYPKFFYYALKSLPLDSKGYARHYSVLKSKRIWRPIEITTQKLIAASLDSLSDDCSRLESIYRSKVISIVELKQSILQKAFAGELSKSAAMTVQKSSVSDMRRDTALMIALAYERHKRNNRDKSFRHTKEQKILHMIEAEAGLDLGREPIRDAAGPNDFRHMLDAEEWAEFNRYFKVSDHGTGYQFQPLARFSEFINSASSIDPTTRKKIEHVIDVFIPMDAQEAQVFATAYAAWNNLLHEGTMPTDDVIVEACYAWHPKKAEIARSKFVKALHHIRSLGMQPTGRASYVPPPAQGQLAL